MIKSKSLLSIISFITFLLLISTSSLVFASYGPEHILKGHFRGKGGASGQPGILGQVSYWNDPSVSEYNFNYTNSINNATDIWSRLSGQFSFTRHSSLQSSTMIQVFVVNNVLPNGVSGATRYFDSQQNRFLTPNEVTNGSVFDVAAIYLDHGRMNGGLFSRSHTLEERYHNTAHEFGHALSMHHFENSPAHSGNHIMKSGRISLTTLTNTDKDHFWRKWY